jgi:proton-translocating NAD(P)+ transhydrogenase subunit beta
VAWAKLSGRIPGRPLLYPGQHLINAALGAALLVIGGIFCLAPERGYPAFVVVVAIALLLGVLLIIPIGGADMPVVICLLNSYSGMAACATGFVLRNNVLIVTGALVGSSGIILTQIMCRAMNRSLANVLFGGFGARAQTVGTATQGEVRTVTPDDAWMLLEAASSVVVVPGYGLAVSQAQHAVKELADLLEARGAEIRYAVHPVAGRMPGHMNVLLAEANVPYEQLVEPEMVNPTMETVEIGLVIGANDVVNPAARDNSNSPLHGMPIVEIDRARTVIVLKRSLAAGFAGVENELFYKPNTRMLLGDAKASLRQLIQEFKEVR